MQTGRNFSEMLRAVDSIQLTTRHPVATPASCQPGEDVMISLMLSDEKAKALYGDFKAPEPYIRIIPQAACLRGSLYRPPSGCSTHGAWGEGELSGPACLLAGHVWHG